MLRIIAEAFERAEREKDAEALLAVCAESVALLERLRKENHMEPLQTLLEHGEIAIGQWRGAAGAKEGLLRLIRQSLQAQPASRYSRKVREAAQYVAAAYQTDLNTESIARHIGISGDHLRHLFKEETGQTLLEYVTAYRMEKAKQLLSTGRYKLYEVADRVGYRSGHYFSKIFLKTTGMHPLDYAENREKAE
ncbi:HTH-type transcriptional activator Btr [compost metagenome]